MIVAAINVNKPIAGRPLTKAQIYENARAIVPFLREHSATIESGRRLPPSVVKKMRDAGFFRLNMPAIWGGPELTSMEQCEVIEEISVGDASAGWCTMIGCDSGIYSGYFEDSIARELYPKLDTIQAGFVKPIGIAERVKGGFRVSGHWPFGSGSTHCDLLAAGCTVFKNGKPVLASDGLPEEIMIVAKPDDYTILDTWHTTGLRGTASNDYICSKLFVPEHQTFNFWKPYRQGTIWRRPDALLRKMSGIPLGIARDAINTVTEMAKRIKDGPARIHEERRTWTTLAMAERTYGAARAYLHESLEALWSRLSAHEEPTVKERAHVVLSRIEAFQGSRRIVQQLYDLAGGNAIYSRKTTLDRNLRDIQTACQHFVGMEREFSRVGELLAGIGKDSPFL
jgi:alkylation response protein AidB-like acyl-CoA dehydrogenase